MEIIKVLFPIWFGLSLFVFFFDWISNIFKWNNPALESSMILALKLPMFANLIFPVASIIAIITVLGRMNKDRELVAMFSVGITKAKIFFTCLMALIICCIPFLILGHYLAPSSTKEYYNLYDTQVKKKQSRFDKIILDKIWHKRGNYLYYVNKYSPRKKQINNLSIFLFDEKFNLKEANFSEIAKWQDSFWQMDNSKLINFKSNLKFTESKIPTQRTTVVQKPNNVEESQWIPEALTQPELRERIYLENKQGSLTQRLQVNYHSRWSFLLLPFVFFLLAFPRVIRFTRESNLAFDITVVVFGSLLYWVIYNLFLGFGNKGSLTPVLAAWIPNIIFTIIGLYFFKTYKLK